jgi:hypothetical protein
MLLFMTPSSAHIPQLLSLSLSLSLSPQVMMMMMMMMHLDSLAPDSILVSN